MNSTKHILQKIIVNDYSYAILRPFIYISDRIKASRKNYQNKEKIKVLETRARAIFKEGVVKHGPFSGMRFSSQASHSSAHYAKLLGSYEKEIHPFLYDILKKPFTRIINVGSDDGYYAVGLALQFSSAQVVAYDLNSKANALTMENAKLNSVSNLEVAGRFDAAELNQISEGERVLFVVDCEGEEKNIFSESEKSKLLWADLIIELHLKKHPELLQYFKNSFSASHDIEVVDSVPDHVKVMKYDYPELAGLNFFEKEYILEEREEHMQWIWLKSKIFAG